MGIRYNSALHRRSVTRSTNAMMCPMFVNLNIGMKGCDLLQCHWSTSSVIHVQPVLRSTLKCCPGTATEGIDGVGVTTEWRPASGMCAAEETTVLC
jgi:hypothetical protein